MIFTTVLVISMPLISYSSQINVLTEEKADKLYFSKLKFTISLLNSLQRNQTNENIFYSPQSLYRTLISAYLCAAGETEKELENLLELSDWANNKTDVENAYRLEKDLRVQNETLEFISVSKIFTANQFSIS